MVDFVVMMTLDGVWAVVTPWAPSPKSTSPSSEHINPIPSNVSMTILVFIYIYLLAKCCYLRFQENLWLCCGMFACKMHVNFSLENIWNQVCSMELLLFLSHADFFLCGFCESNILSNLNDNSFKGIKGFKSLWRDPYRR